LRPRTRVVLAWALWLVTFGWAPAIGLGVTLPALLLPNGHLRSRRWWLVRASLWLRHAP
jgi:hypothetical protein